MTAPAGPPDVDALAALRVDQDDELQALTAQLTAQLGDALAAALDVLLRELTALWVRLFGDVDAQPGPDDDELLADFRAQAAQLVDELLPVDDDQLPVDVLLAGLVLAAALGAAQAVAATGIVLGATIGRPSADTLAQARTVRGSARAAVDRAQQLLAAGPLDSYGDVLAVVGTARQSLTAVERTTRTVATRALAEGVTALADDNGLPRLWIPERDACLHCLRYAGRIAKPGETFPEGLTYGDKPLPTGPVAGPPLHPNCRCRVVPWLGVAAYASERSPGGKLPVGQDYPGVLRREADRAVLRGWATGESNVARLRAADRLLRRGVALPKTVKRRAAAAVLAGRFVGPPPP